jgi:DNA-damage-inducible protein D
LSDEILVHDAGPDGPDDFEACGHDNGHRYWWESDLRQLLGYGAGGGGWEKAVGRAIAACTALAIPVQENFEHTTRELDGDPISDCKLSRFACYLIAMNGDPRKPEVARAQAYFASFAEAARQMALHVDGVERVVVRDEMIDREKSLSSVAKGAGVSDYALFQNAGYRGLYNMNLSQLKRMKGVQNDRSLLDFMGKEELAANLFRITQTEAKIRKENVRGQYHLERTAESVGSHVRNTIEQIGGTMPERLPPAEDLKSVKSGLKKTARELKKLDKKKLPPKGGD